MFKSIADVPGFLHAATSDEAGPNVVYVYASVAVELEEDSIADPLRNFVAGRCHSKLQNGSFAEPMFWDGRGQGLTLAMLDECPGPGVPHVCST